jgi:hypothetical protein
VSSADDARLPADARGRAGAHGNARAILIGIDPADHREAPLSDCVLSSRVRLARNLIGFNFVNRSSPEQLSDVVHRVQAARLGGRALRQIHGLGVHRGDLGPRT